MKVQLLAEQHLKFLSFKRGCKGSSESTLVKIPHCWKSHDVAQLISSIKHTKEPAGNSSFGLALCGGLEWLKSIFL